MRRRWRALAVSGTILLAATLMHPALEPLRAALGTLGYGSDVQTVHGFRATARTLLDEVLEFDPLVIEAQLAHKVKDANGRAYNRTTYREQRAAMMQRWADYLDKLRKGAEVVQLKKA